MKISRIIATAGLVLASLGVATAAEARPDHDRGYGHHRYYRDHGHGYYGRGHHYGWRNRHYRHGGYRYYHHGYRR